jgi:hypothetical protein
MLYIQPYVEKYIHVQYILNTGTKDLSSKNTLKRQFKHDL